MDEEFKKIERIEAFLNGDLNAVEKAKFEKELELNNELRAEVDLHADIETLLVVQEKKERFSEWSDLIIATEKEKRNSSKAGLKPIVHPKSNRSAFIQHALRAAAIFALAFGVYFMWPSDPATNELAQLYYQKPNSIVTVLRSDQNPNEQLAAEANIEFKNGNYKEALNKIKQLPLSNERLIAEGLAEFELQNFKEAKGAFLKVLKDQNSNKNDEAIWYLALSELSLNNKEEAKKYLVQIVSTQSWQSNKAYKILKEIK